MTDEEQVNKKYTMFLTAREIGSPMKLLYNVKLNYETDFHRMLWRARYKYGQKGIRQIQES